MEAPAALPANVTPAETGMGVAQSLETTSEVQQKVYHDAYDQANEAAAMRGYNALSSWEQQNLHDAKGGPNGEPPKGILYQTNGLNAPKAVDDLMQQYQAHVSDIAESMSNPAQQQAFANMAAHHQGQVVDQLGRYEHEQVTTAHNQIASDRVMLSQQSAVQQAGDPKAAVQALNDIRGAIADQGKWNQWSPERVQLAQEQAVSSTNMEILRQLGASGQDQQQKAWYDAHKDEFKGADLPSATAMVDKSSTDGAAQRFADAHTINPDGTFVSEQQINDVLRKDPTLLANPKLRDQVDERMHRMAAQNRQAVEQSQRGVMDDCLSKVQSGMDVDDPYIQTHRAGMSPEQWSVIQSAGRKDIAEPDPVMQHQIRMNLSQPETRQEWAKADLTRMGIDPRSKFYGEAAKMQEEIARTGTHTEAPQVLARQTQIDQSLQGAGISTEKDASGNYGAPYLAMNRQLLNWEAGVIADSKKKPTTDERQQEIDRLLTKQVIDDGPRAWYNPARWFGDANTSHEGFRFEDPRTSQQAHTALQVPDAARSSLEGEFRKAGIQPTSGQVADLYNVELAGLDRGTPELQPQDLQEWTKILGNKQDPQYAARYAKLKRWTTGQAEEGYLEPRLITSARQILGAMGVPPDQTGGTPGNGGAP